MRRKMDPQRAGSALRQKTSAVSGLPSSRPGPRTPKLLWSIRLVLTAVKGGVLSADGIHRVPCSPARAALCRSSSVYCRHSSSNRSSATPRRRWMTCRRPARAARGRMKSRHGGAKNPAAFIHSTRRSALARGTGAPLCLLTQPDGERNCNGHRRERDDLRLPQVGKVDVVFGHELVEEPSERIARRVDEKEHALACHTVAQLPHDPKYDEVPNHFV